MSGDTSKYTVGILGAGQIVQNMHLPVLKAMPEVEVSWLFDVNLRKAQEVASAFRVPAVHSTMNDLPHADIVLVAVPYGVREPIYEALRDRKNALYVEKPFAKTVAQHEKYLSWFSHSQIAIGFQKRAVGSASVLRAIIESRVFGHLLHIRVEHGLCGVLTGSGYSSDFDLAGGGILFEVAIHWIDLALFMSGATLACMDQGRMIRENGFDLHTEAVLVLKNAEEQEMSFEVLVSGLMDTRNRTSYRFSSGVELSYSHSTARITLPIASNDLDIALSSDAAAYPLTAHQLCCETWRGLLDSIRFSVVNWTSARTSIVTTSVLEALYGLDE